MQNERVLFHYNGHGVPRPTANGEIWVFNKSYTQYIPMSVYDLQAWVGSPAIYVFDCSAAGLIINSFRAFAEQRTQVRLASAAPAGDGAIKIVPRDMANSMADVSPAAMQRHARPQCVYCAAQEAEQLGSGYVGSASSQEDNIMKEVILLAACSAGEVLPQSPDLPADVFTACLTTPIKVCAAPRSKLGRTEHAISLEAVIPADPTCVVSLPVRFASLWCY